MEELLDLYAKPYDAQRPLICIDESNKQLLESVQPTILATKNHSQRYDTKYKRHGVANLFMGFEPLAGQRIVEVTERRTKMDFAHFIQSLVDEHYSQADVLVVVLDNLNTHTKASLYEAFAPPEAKRLADKLEIHYTPINGSWLNMAEIELSQLSCQCLDRRIEGQERLNREVKAWEQERNLKQAKVDWQFTTEDARIKLKRLYPTF